jgi:hypothetical protein
MDYIPSGPRPGKPDYVRSTPRPLVVFRDNLLFGSHEKTRVFSREFSPGEIERFDDVWFNQRRVPRGPNKPGDRSRSQRLARGARWTVDLAAPLAALGRGGQQEVAALVLAGDTLFVAGREGGLLSVAAGDGRKLAAHELPPPVWDGMAAAYGNLYVSTSGGDLVCLGER